MPYESSRNSSDGLVESSDDLTFVALPIREKKMVS